MKHPLSLWVTVLALLLMPMAQAQDGRVWHVSQSTGSNGNDGSREHPLKNIQAAIDLASPGDEIRVAEGNYYGLSDAGNIRIDKGVSIVGGYAADFSERDVLRHRTFVQPTAASNASAQGQGTVQINVRQEDALVELDGLIMDRGNSVAYNPRGEGRPEGVETPMMQPVGSAGVGALGVSDPQVYTTETAIVYIQTGSKSHVAIRNCAFLNGPNYGLLGATYAAEVTVDNCIFVNIRMAAVELRGSAASANSRTHVTNSTILFVWSRLKDLGDMGYGYRYLPRMDSFLRGNILGCCVLAALDGTRTDGTGPDAQPRVNTCENTLFFRNRAADLLLPGENGGRRVRVEDFGRLPQADRLSGNRAVSDPAVFGGAVDEAYLKGFLDPDTQMFANHYPVEEALRLFGAVPGYGAQIPK